MHILLLVLLTPLFVAAVVLSLALFIGELYLVNVIIKAIKSAYRESKQPDEEVPDA